MHFATLPGFDIRFLAMSATSTVRATPLGQAVRAHLFYRNWSRLSQSRTWISVVRIPFAFKGIGLLWPNTLTVQADSLHTPAGVVLIYFSFRFAAAPRQVHSTFIFYFGCKANSHSLSTGPLVGTKVTWVPSSKQPFRLNRQCDIWELR